MYLISLYFDEETDGKIRSYIKQIARHTGNRVMVDGNIPPHITIAAFDCDSKAQAVEFFQRVIIKMQAGKLKWVSVGSFLPRVLYISPVLNEYLQNISEIIYKEMSPMENVMPKGTYGPYQWVPHATLGKHLEKEQMRTAFKIMQDQFAPFESRAVRCGLAKTNPYEDVLIYELKQ